VGPYLIAEASTLVYAWEMLLLIIKVAVAIGALIFVHELGHFVVAKLCGVKCEKFYIGFDVPIRIGPLNLPPKLFVKQWGETEYGVGIIPLGGYVKMLGQDDNPAKAQEEAERIRIRKSKADGDQGAQPDGKTDSQELPAGEKIPNVQPDAEKYELDPRSYPAKSVPQRMAIISAGVIMNLVFAVICATIAYGLGVSYTPCVIGGTVPGGPAWIEDLPAGWRVVAKNSRVDEHIRWRQLIMSVAMTGKGNDLRLVIRDEKEKNKADAKTKTVTLQPSKTSAESKLPSIGVYPSPTTTKLAPEDHVMDHLPGGRTKVPFHAGDEVVALVVDGKRHPIKYYEEMRAVLAQYPGQTLTFVVRRAEEKTQSDASADQGKTVRFRELEIEVAPNPLRQLGIVMPVGPITAIQKRSPAVKAGFKVGDVIKRVNGKEVGKLIQTEDGPMVIGALTLPQYVQQLAETEIRVEVLRDGKPVPIDVTPRMPQTYESQRIPGAPMGIEALGVAYSVPNTVELVVPGSPASEQGLKAGDRLMSAKFLATTKEQKRQQKKLGLPRKAVELDGHQNWLSLDSEIQFAPPDMKLQIEYKRDGKLATADLLPVASDRWYNAARGFRFCTKEGTHVAGSFGEAVRLGFRETKDSMLHVFLFLRKLMTGEMSLTSLGGPGTIAVVAGSEAQAGIARLLVFLTLLSANLAIINFLPIPVLDGGHMLFLTYEGVVGRPVDELWAMRLTVAGLVFILGLMVFVIGLDVFYHIPQLFA